MKAKSLYLFLFYSILSINISAQNTAKLVKYHINDDDKRDVDQAYINAQTAKIKSPDNSSFEDGFIFRNSDTVKCRIYFPAHKFNNDFYLYVIVKLSNDSSYVYTPKDIAGYSVRNFTMIAHRSVKSVDTSFFFIRLIEKGKITLYDRGKIPSNNQYNYYFY